ncbi:hypothetical protein BJX76DRAFT_315804 [Aspergillus varians]
MYKLILYPCRRNPRDGDDVDLLIPLLFTGLGLDLGCGFVHRVLEYSPRAIG